MKTPATSRSSRAKKASAQTRSRPSRRRVQLTRRELHRAVWSRPLSTFARELGISPNALAKICDRLLVPYPTRGYWARRKAGKKEPPPPLPPAPEGNNEICLIAGSRSASRRPRTRLSPEARREQLIDVAGRIVAKQGLHALSMRSIARECGISEAQLYNYFPRCQDLLVALARRELEAMNATRQAEANRGTDHLTRITLSTISYLRQVEERGALIQILLGSPEVRSALRTENKARRRSGALATATRFREQYGVPEDLALATTVILTNLCLRAGRLLARRRLPLATAQHLTLAMVTQGNLRIASLSKRERPAA
jgi:AcrR family transcriptional regulator